MAIRISQIHPADNPKALNTEWFIVENTGTKPFSTRNCVISVTPRGGKRKTDLVTLDPGFVLAPGEQVRVVTGNPGRKAHGVSPKDDTEGYNLFLNTPALRGGGTTITFSLRSLTLATATFDASSKDGTSEEGASKDGAGATDTKIDTKS